MEGTLMKKRLIALLLLLTLLVPAGLASAVTYYRVNTSSLKVHYLPSESAKVLGSYRRDYALTINSTKDGWSYVTFSNGFEGYVEKKYLAKAQSYGAWITRDETALRKGPDGSFDATAMLARGRKVTVLSHGANYDYVSAGSLGTGYVVNSLLSKKKVKASGNPSYSTEVTGGKYYAYVINAGDRKVNLRSAASKNAPIISQYSPGTEVYVVTHSAVWDKVKVDGNTGYMMTKYLTRSAPAPTDPPVTVTPPPVSYTAYVVTPNKEPVNARRGKSTNYAVAFKVPYGAAVTVLQHNTKWDYIKYRGQKAYVQNTYLFLKKPSDAPDDPDPTPTPTPVPFEPYKARITSENGKSVNVHKKPYTWSSNVDFLGDHGRLAVGTKVKVIAKADVKGWSEIEYKGLTGYVMDKYLDRIK